MRIFLVLVLLQLVFVVFNMVKVLMRLPCCKPKQEDPKNAFYDESSDEADDREFFEEHAATRIKSAIKGKRKLIAKRK